MRLTGAHILRPSSMAESCMLPLPIFGVKCCRPCLSPPANFIRFHFSSSSSSACFSGLSLKKKCHPSIACVAQASEWAQRDDDTIFLDENLEAESEQEERLWENQGLDESEARLSEWEADGEDSTIDVSEAAGESDEVDVLDGAVTERESYVEPPEDAKIFVGNLPYDVDSENLAMLFQKAGTVEIAEVIYNRATDQSRGFGFVTMSTVEEAEKAVEMFHRYEVDGRLLTVNKAAPRGQRPELHPRESEPSFRIYVGNLPWDIANARLEQVFSEHGKVVEARVVYDRETGRSRGFGYVGMSTETEMNNAIAALDGQTLEGRTIRVSVAEERPRRRF